MAERKPLRFAQALVETGKDVDCKIYKIPYKEFTYEDLETYLEYGNALPLGLGAGYWKDSTKLAVLAIVSAETGIVVEFPEPSRRFQADAAPTVDTVSERYQALQILLARPAGEFFSFDMAPLSMTLYLEQNLRMTNAVDIQSAFPSTDRYSISKILKAALGDETKIWETNLASAFDNIEYNPSIRTSVLEPVKRAWLAYHLASVDDAVTTYSDTPRINTLEMDAALLEVISKITVDSQRLDHKRPDQIVRDFTYAGYDAENDEHKVESNAFKNRFRGSEKVRVTVEDASGSFAARGQVDATGKLALFSDGGLGIGSRVITTIIGLGREPPTAAAKARDRSLLRLLQMIESPENPWLQNIWFNKDASSISWPEEWFSGASKYPPLSPSVTADLAQAASRLNTSQQVAVNAMLSKDPDHVLTIVQGPPGTGKTSVIAFFVQMAVALGKTGLWLVAQSNVAVKNIAEKLSSVGFNDYRLLVSREFIKDWHDHLYSDVNRNVIRSDEFTTLGPNQTRGIKVYLCTLSMLAHPLLRIFVSKCPLNTLIVDEASQIHVADYVSIFYKYSSLRKACFIGDDKQLPPFGQEDAPDGLPSIFEVEHLRGHAFFLNTQCLFFIFCFVLEFVLMKL
ncbi:hypothetical protein P691DRAFT_294664 [Macrolepiota fuliginosa MF-IS2]|uniref:DNA2/NAM7 helicase helicase domain-containing protein n=1 Tax=Macrolepiota fuliginosa MF-IS2 TaxID=1400762 RepID=A0A9P5XK56_9AGAR|nr:hypothetical protein P691DRAFT_294664 [Macrolepiota fuliginosa MF-IS2]